MAESIAIFGLAANIVQFLDIGSKFVSSAWKIYSSGRNGMGKISDLVRLTGDLQTILKGLQTSDENINATIEGEHDLRQLAKQCQSVAMELLDSLERINPPVPIRKRDALSVTFKMLWAEEEITGLQSRLDGFRHQLTLHLLALLR